MGEAAELKVTLGPISSNFLEFSRVFSLWALRGAKMVVSGASWRQEGVFGISWRVLALRWGSSGASWSQDGTLVARIGAKLPQDGANMGQHSAKECQEGPR